MYAIYFNSDGTFTNSVVVLTEEAFSCHIVSLPLQLV